MNGVTTKYTLEGSLVKFERTGSTNIWYYHDASGSPVGMCIGGTNLYLYRKNLQGDITGIYSGSTGALLVNYVYDAWGKPTITNVAGTTESTNLMARNPYLYRGYRYDHETGLYYLNSRYYDPETGRFVNADVMVSTNQGIHSTNMFAYCEDNPINLVDYYGLEAAELLGWWSGFMWWLGLVDGPVPVGDLVYAGGVLLLGCVALYELCCTPTSPQILNESEDLSKPDEPGKTEEEKKPQSPDIKYPSDDPAKPPSDDYEWRGISPQGGEKGGYANKNGIDSWHPDLKHKPPVKPHWDWNDGLGHKYRVFPDNSIEQLK